MRFFKKFKIWNSLIIFIFISFIAFIFISQFIKNNERELKIEEFRKEYFSLYNKESQYFYDNYFLYKRFIFYFNNCFFFKENEYRDTTLRDHCIDKVSGMLSQYHSDELIDELITNFYNFSFVFNKEAKKIKNKYNIKNEELPFKI